MRIERDFDVPVAPADAFALLVDLERVGPCIPGGEVGAPDDDGTYPASIAVALGPMRMTYKGTVRIAERDDGARRAVLAAEMREQRGQGTAKATMTMSVAEANEDGGGAQVSTVTELKLTGRAAQMGRGVVDDVAARLVGELAECIAAKAGSGEGGGAGEDDGGDRALAPAKPISGARLMLRVLWERIKRVFRRRGDESNA